MKKLFAENRGDYSFEKTITFARVEVHFPCVLAEVPPSLDRIGERWKRSVLAEIEAGDGETFSAYELGNHKSPISLEMVDEFCDRAKRLLEDNVAPRGKFSVKAFVCARYEDEIAGVVGQREMETAAVS